MNGRPVGLGVVGAASFVANAAILPAVAASTMVTVAAVSSRGGVVADEWDDLAVADYDAVIEHPDVEAVYIPLPNGLHAEWTHRCAAQGRHVLCEKPLARDATEAATMATDCRAHGVLLAEAWMTPFDPRFATALRMAGDGAVGDVRRVEGTFTFTMRADQVDNYRWVPHLGGGALADVGIYCLGAAVALFGPDAQVVSAQQMTAASGVDIRTEADLRWPGGETARVRCSFVDDDVQHLAIIGTRGELHLDGDAFTGGSRACAIVDASGATVAEVEPDDCYRRMVDAFAAAVRGTQEWPRPIERSIEMMTIIDDIGRVAGAHRVR